MTEMAGDLKDVFSECLFIRGYPKRMVEPTAMKSRGNQYNSNCNLFYQSSRVNGG